MARRLLLALSLALTLILSSLSAQEKPQPLWPAGEAPYFAPDIDSGRPKLVPYPVPTEEANGASVIVCPGGGYGGIAADHEGHQIAQFFNQLGVHAYVLHYRLGSKGYHYPAQLADVQRALRTVRHRAVASPTLDPGRIGIIGFSAGGHLASMATTLFDRKAYPLDPEDPIDSRSARPDIAALCYPFISMIDGVTHDGSRKNLSGEDQPDDQSAKILSLSSELNVPADAPPTFLFHTSEDSVVPAENSIRFYQALRKNRIPAELHIYQRGPHGIGLFRSDPSVGTWSRLLQTWLRNSGFFAGATERTSVQGEVTLDGVAVSWGSISFLPEDKNLPATTLRIRNGKFRADTAVGPVSARSGLRFELSIWEKTQNPDDRVLQTDRLVPHDPNPLVIEIRPPSPATTPDNEPGPAQTFTFDLKSK